MKKLKTLILVATSILISGCDNFLSVGSSNINSNSSNILLETSSLKTQEEKVYFASADKVTFNIDINKEKKILNFEDINTKNYYQLFCVNANDAYIKSNYKILYYTRIEPISSSYLDEVSYSNMNIDMTNGELNITRQYNIFKDFEGYTALSYYRELILIPIKWIPYLNDELIVNVTKIYLDDIETRKESLSSLLPWVNELDKNDIKQVEYGKYYFIAPGNKYNYYYSNDIEDINNVYSFLKGAVMRKPTSIEIPEGGGGFEIIIKTNDRTYSLKCENSYYSINGEIYECINNLNYKFLKNIDTLLGYKYVTTITNAKLYSKEDLLEEIPNLFSQLVFIENDNSKVIDITSDLYLKTLWGNINVIDAKHFSIIDPETNVYHLYKIVNGFDFSSYIEKYKNKQENLTINIYEENELFASIMCDKNISIEASWLINILNDYYGTIINHLVDKNRDVITKIDVSDNLDIYIDREIYIPLNAQFVRTGCLDIENHKNHGVIIKSIGDLSNYYLENKEQYCLDEKYSEYSFIELINKYKENYFMNNILVILSLLEYSGSISHEIENIGIVDSKLQVDINRLIPPYQNCDMAQWFILIEVPNDITNNVIGVEINISDVNIESDYGMPV